MRAKANAALVALHLIAAVPAAAQLPGSLAADRARLAEITRDSTVAAHRGAWLLGDLIPALARPIARSGADFILLQPDFRVTWNSAIPFSLNDGGMWAGRGTSFTISGGVRADRSMKFGMLSLSVAPTIDYSQNLPYQIIPDGSAGRSGYASPFHRPGPLSSADTPIRFGDRHILRIDPGQTALAVQTGRILAGVTAESEVWGPGIRNQLIMSANAPGIPRIFLSTSGPMRTRIGSVRAKLVSGTLTESLFFDTDAGNNNRSLSGLLLELTPAFDSTLTFGFERIVYTPIGPYASPFTTTLARSFDALLRWEYIAPPGDENPDGTPHQKSDQISALFARWIFPESGFEVYGEWARLDLPRSLTEVLTAGHHTLGYTLGFQWAQPKRKGSYLRLQSEFTNLEQSRVFADRPPPDFYAGRVSPQGYTQRGQVIGAAIGPGGSSQWVALDYIAPTWQFGWYAGRIRWENDALYRQPIPSLFMHDVTVLTGLRGARRTRWTDISLDATFGYRFNYLFQNGIPNPGGYAFRTVDVRNFTISMAMTPR